MRNGSMMAASGCTVSGSPLVWPFVQTLHIHSCSSNLLSPIFSCLWVPPRHQQQEVEAAPTVAETCLVGILVSLFAPLLMNQAQILVGSSNSPSKDLLQVEISVSGKSIGQESLIMAFSEARESQTSTYSSLCWPCILSHSYINKGTFNCHSSYIFYPQVYFQPQ